MSIFVSSGAFPSVTHLSDLLPVCREQGVRHVELASGLRADMRSLGALEKMSAEGFSFLLHNYFPAPDSPFVLNLADKDEANRLRSIEFCREAMRISLEVGAPFYSVHAGFVATLRAEDLGRPDRQNFVVGESEYSDSLARFTKSVGELDQIASETGIQLLLENNVDAVGSAERSHLLLVSGEDIVSFFSEHRFDNVGLLMDVAHLKVSATHRHFVMEEALAQAAPWIGALHLSDNDGQRDTNSLCRDDSWFWDPLRLSISPDTPAVLEAYRLSPSEIEEQVALIESKLARHSVSK